MTVSVRNGNTLRAGGMAEWFKAAVLKTVVRKYRGFESYSLRHTTERGEMTELADGARLLSECGGYTPPRVRIPLSPPPFFLIINLSIPPEQTAFYPPCYAFPVVDLHPPVFLFQRLKNHSIMGLGHDPVSCSRTAANIDPFFRFSVDLDDHMRHPVDDFPVHPAYGAFEILHPYPVSLPL